MEGIEWFYFGIIGFLVFHLMPIYFYANFMRKAKNYLLSAYLKKLISFVVILLFFASVANAATIVASNEVQYSNTSVVGFSTYSLTPVTLYEFTLNNSYSGTWTISFSMRSTNYWDEGCECYLDATAYAQVYYNDVVAGTLQSTPGNAYVTKTENLSVSSNVTKVEIKGYATSPGYSLIRYLFINFTLQPGYNNTNTILFSNTTDWQTSQVTSTPIGQQFYVNAWTAGWNASDIYFLEAYTPAGANFNRWWMTNDQPFQKAVTIPTNWDYGNYLFKVWNSTGYLSEASILIHDESNPDLPYNPNCTWNCTPLPPGYFDPNYTNPTHPYFESATLFWSQDENGVTRITGAYRNHTSYLHFSHPNGDYTNYTYNISFLKPDDSVFYNLSVDNIESGHVSWFIPSDAYLGTWMFNFTRMNKTDSSFLVMNTTTLYISSEPTPPPSNVSILSGYVKQNGTFTPISDATVKAVKGYTLIATTNALGYYQIPNMLDGNYTVTASRTGYVSKSVSITIANASINNQNFYLDCDGPCPTPTPTPTPTATETPIGPTPTAPPPPSETDLGVMFWNNLYIWAFAMVIMIIISFFDKR